jgi:hypothetical protein
LWCYVVSCDVIILQRALLILPCIIFESITPYYQQCWFLWCYVVSCDVIILQRALLILPCIIFESITPYLLVI